MSARSGFCVAIALGALSACGESPPAPATADSDGIADLPIALESLFVPSGRMGDAEAGEPFVFFDRRYRGQGRPGDHDGVVTRVAYSFGRAGRAGVFWQWPDGNRGESPGRSLAARKLVFFARGETGEEKVEFRIGGTGIGNGIASGGDNEPQAYRDSVDRSTGGIPLATVWTRYEIDLAGADLSSVIIGFAWVVQASGNTEPVVFYFDDIRFE